jgi:hypothetical protein
VVIRIQDYRHDCERQLAMAGEEFVARFVFHILARRMQRVRFAGLFQPNVRKRRVALCHRLLAGRDEPPAPEARRPLQQRRASAPEYSPEAAETAEAPETAEPLRRDPAGAHEAAADQTGPHEAGAPEVPWEPERPPRLCPRCLMPGLQFMGRLRPDEARRFIRRLEWLLRGMITIITTLEVPPVAGRRRRGGDYPDEEGTIR